MPLYVGSGLLINLGEPRNESIFLYNIRDFQNYASQTRCKSYMQEEGEHILDLGEETKLSGS